VLCLLGGALAVSLAGDVGAAASAPAADGPSPDTLGYYVEPFPYRIAPGDGLFVDFGIALDLKPVEANLIVRPDGVATLPRIGDVRVVGLTTSEVDTLLARLYSSIYVNPKITVAIREVAGNMVHVLGEVRAPGSYPMTPNTTALQAIARAGGFDEDAARGDVLVLRRAGPTQVSVKKLNLKALLSGHVAGADIMLRRFDIVYVNRSAIGDVTRFVNHVVTPLLNVQDAYIRGWEAVHIEQVFPGTVRTGIR
jgi:polysaccharide export outer membrane protein